MPPEEEKTTIDSAEAPEEESQPKKGRSKLILFGSVGVALAVIAVAGVMLLGGTDESADGEVDATHEVAEADGGHGEKAKSSKKHRTGKSFVYEIDDIVVNPAGTGGSRFLSISFGFELGTPELAKDFESREALVRDALITILSSKTVSQLTDPKQKEITRYQIKKRLEQVMACEDLEAVYYTDFVLQ